MKTWQHWSTFFSLNQTNYKEKGKKKPSLLSQHDKVWKFLSPPPPPHLTCCSIFPSAAALASRASLSLATSSPRRLSWLADTCVWVSSSISLSRCPLSSAWQSTSETRDVIRSSSSFLTSWRGVGWGGVQEREGWLLEEIS